MIDAAAPTSKDTGVVTSNLKAGELFLESESGEVYRLTWAARGRRRERRVPVGKYRLMGYRLVSGDWHLSVSGGRREVVVGDAPTVVKVPQVVVVDLRARRQRGEVSLQMGISNGAGTGLSLFNTGARVPIRFRLTGLGGAEVAAGLMSYG